MAGHCEARGGEREQHLSAKDGKVATVAEAARRAENDAGSMTTRAGKSTRNHTTARVAVRAVRAALSPHRANQARARGGPRQKLYSSPSLKVLLSIGWKW